MPQVMAAVLIGAGIAAGAKWLVREFLRAAEATRLAGEDLGRAERVKIVTKDLGRLEWDPETGVYRPAGNRRR
jgi:hypothetical protein